VNPLFGTLAIIFVLFGLRVLGRRGGEGGSSGCYPHGNCPAETSLGDGDSNVNPSGSSTPIRWHYFGYGEE